MGGRVRAESRALLRIALAKNAAKKTKIPGFVSLARGMLRIPTLLALGTKAYIARLRNMSAIKVGTGFDLYCFEKR
jgi:hypothetical protein